MQFLNRSVALPVTSALLVAGLAAQQASYSVYGHGCAGTGPDPVVCGALNSGGGASSLASLPNEYCYHHKAASAIRVIGFRLWTKTFAANTQQVIGIGIYKALAGAPRQAAETTGTMLVMSQDGFYTGYLATAVDIAKDEDFWVSQFDTKLTRAAGLDAGTPGTGTTYWRPAAGSADPWAATGIVKNPCYEILCEGTTAPGTGVPNLTYSDLPRLGQVFTLNLHHAPARPTNLIIGVQPQNLDLTLIGAPGCRLLLTMDAVLPVPTPTNGSVTVRIPIPNQPVLRGFVFYNQFYISEPLVNRLKVTTSNGGSGQIGI